MDKIRVRRQDLHLRPQSFPPYHENIGISVHFCREKVPLLIHWAPHVCEQHRFWCSGRWGKAGAGDAMARVPGGAEKAGTGPDGIPVKPQAAAEKKQDCERAVSSALFPTSPSPPPSVRLFPPLSPSISAPRANLHLLISTQHVYELIPTPLCQDGPLANVPHPLATCAFAPTDCSSDNSRTRLSALTSLCVRSARVPEGLQTREARLQSGSPVSSRGWAE